MQMGNLCYTRGVGDRLEEDAKFSQFVLTCLRRHKYGDWGDLCEEDKQINNEAVQHGGRLLSSYHYKDEEDKIWVITEADRSVTTVLLPEEY